MTFIEVLTVIGIVVLLAALLTPVISRGLDSVHLAKCTSNLRQLWTAQKQYQTDHDGSFIPYAETETSYVWTARLMQDKYLPERTDVFVCPAFSKKTDLRASGQVARQAGGDGAASRRGSYSHYGYNYNHLGSSIRYTSSAEDRAEPAKTFQITSPAKTILFVDSLRSNTSDTPRGSYIAVDRQDTQNIPEARHRGSVNVVFVDGHVEAITLTDPKDPFLAYPDGLGRTTQTGSLWKR